MPQAKYERDDAGAMSAHTTVDEDVNGMATDEDGDVNGMSTDEDLHGVATVEDVNGLAGTHSVSIEIHS